jgi:hypothetical protein
MIITLLGADFSSDNLGTVEIPFELTERQRQMLAMYSKVLTGAQKKAFGIFQSTLETSGIWEKIDSLYLPVLAGQLSETFINVKDLTQMSSTFTQEAVTNFTSAHFELNNGIRQLGSGDGYYLFNTTLKDADINDFHYLTFNPSTAAYKFGLSLADYRSTTKLEVINDNDVTFKPQNVTFNGNDYLSLVSSKKIKNEVGLRGVGSSLSSIVIYGSTDINEYSEVAYGTPPIGKLCDYAVSISGTGNSSFASKLAT